MHNVILFLAQLDRPPNQAGGEALQNILSNVFIVVGILSVIFVLIGGFRYVISAGDPQKISQAKDTILYALIGAVVAASAFAIVNFIFSEIESGSDNTQTQTEQTTEGQQEQNLEENLQQQLDEELNQDNTSSFLLIPAAYAQDDKNLCPEGVDNEICEPSASANDLAVTIVNALSLIIGAVAVVMIIVGGLRYVISGGDQQAVAGARNTILYALVGLVIAASAQAIVRFVFDAAQGELPEAETKNTEGDEAETSRLLHTAKGYIAIVR